MRLLSSPLRTHLLASAMLAAALCSSPEARAAATITILNNDPAGVGFNDPTAVAPVGGNSGTTLGQQRLNAFQAAANIWGANLTSSVVIIIRAQWAALTCNATSAVLGSAGAVSVQSNFTGAPQTNTWYPTALANALRGLDLDPGNPDINATFNVNLGQTGCLTGSGWYYGLDGNPSGSLIDLVSVLLHEFGHGLGFQTFVNASTGAKLSGVDDAYMRNLESHGAVPPDYPSMTDSQRVAAAIATGNLHWTGTHVRAASRVLSAGKVGTHVRMNAPNPVQPGSSVSHWDTVLTPNQMMEPSYTGPLHSLGLEMQLFNDIGWPNLSTPTNASAHNFNADGRSDIAWRQTGGAAAVWLMNGASIASSAGLGTVPVTWSLVGQRDFDGDGKHDLLWRDTSGNTAIWFMNGTAIASTASVGVVPAVWSIAGTADFNNDGKGDLLWRDTSGNTAIWLMNGASASSSASLGTIAAPWVVAGTADFNDDGNADILWRNTTTGDVAIWFMNGTVVSSTASVGTVPPAWSIVATGDFNGDGKADLVWRDTGGNTAIWLMNGATVLSAGSLGTIAAPWSIVEAGDFNGDGKSDLLWRNTTTGDTAIWFMNGTALSSTASVATVTTDWTIQNANVN